MPLLSRLFVKLQIAFVAILLFSAFSVPAQMRKVYKDGDSGNEIKKISFFSPNEGFVAFANEIGYTADSGRTFVKKKITLSNVDFNKYTVNVTSGFIINGVVAFDKNNIIAYGQYSLEPSILLSSDGGNTFKLVFHQAIDPANFTVQNSIIDMAFPQLSSTGYALDADNILKTTDKGKTWTVLSNVHIAKVVGFEAASDNVLSVSANYSWKTSDGGNSWQNISLPSLSDGTLTSIYFLTADIGWVSMYSTFVENIYKTTNGGRSWTLQNDPVVTPFRAVKMRFVDENTGYAIPLGENALYKTSNGGALWEPLARDNNDKYALYDFQYLLPNQLWTGGSNGILEMSTNNGAELVPKAYFKTDTTGVLASSKVSLLNYSNSGYSYKWLVNGVQVGTDYNATYSHDVRASRDTIKLINSNAFGTDTMVRYQQFYVPRIPAIDSFGPGIASLGTVVTIAGNNFGDVIGVSFGGVPAASFKIVSNNIITAVVANGASGAITLKCLFGSFSIDGFQYSNPPTAPAPVITSMSPSSGPIGTLVTISGNNFAAAPNQNIIQFGATKATVLSASSTQLTCLVPAGANFQPLSVLNKTNGLIGSSQMPFNVTFADTSAFTGHSFSESYQLPFDGVRATFGQLLGSDFDDDGKPDILADMGLSSVNDSFCIWRNTTTPGGPFSFSKRQTISRNWMGTIYGFSIGDIDGDGKSDFAGITSYDFINVVRNNSTPGNMNFEKQIVFKGRHNCIGMSMDDLDGDGRRDIVSHSNDTISIFRNTSVPGSISFAAPFDLRGTSYSGCIGDLDGDGKKEIIYAYGKLFVFPNQSSPGVLSFKEKLAFSIPANIIDTSIESRPSLCDFDGDGKPDVVVSSNHGQLVFRNTSVPGTISFAPAVYYTEGRWVSGLIVDNLNGDALPDMVGGYLASYDVLVYQNLSQKGSISNAKSVYVGGGNDRQVSSADFDLDGRNDLLVDNSADAYILKNNVGQDVVIEGCENHFAKMDADLTGTNYQWQRYNGSAYVNVIPDSIYEVDLGSMWVHNIKPAMNGTKYRCLVDGKPTCTFVIKVSWSDSALVKITSNLDSVCAGAPVTFTATASNAGTNPSYRWAVNGVYLDQPDSTVFTSSSLRNNDKVSVYAASSNTCWSNVPVFVSNAITVTVLGQGPKVQIVSSKSSICKDDAVTFNSLVSDTTRKWSYQWLVNDVNTGIDSSAFVSTRINNNDKIKVAINNPYPGCANLQVETSNIITMKVDPWTMPSVNIVVSPDSCEGTTISFNAKPANVGANPAYQWYINNEKAGTNAKAISSNQLKNKDEVKVLLRPNKTCSLMDSAWSNTIVTVVSPRVTPTITIKASSTEICKGASAVFTATYEYGGARPAFVWSVNGNSTGTTIPEFTTASVQNGDQVKVAMLTLEACASPAYVESNIITISVKPVPQPEITITGNTVVTKGSFANISTSLTNGGISTSQTFRWQDSTVNHSWADVSFGNENIIAYVPKQTGDKLRCIFHGSSDCGNVAIDATSNVLSFVVNGTDSTVNNNGGNNNNNNGNNNNPNNDNATIHLYPNPVTNSLTIDGPDMAAGWTTVEIRNSTGNLAILVQNTNGASSVTISVEKLEPGIYVAVVRKSNGEVKKLRFMKL